MHPSLDVGGVICFGNRTAWSTGKKGWTSKSRMRGPAPGDHVMDLYREALRV